MSSKLYRSDEPVDVRRLPLRSVNESQTYAAMDMREAEQIRLQMAQQQSYAAGEIAGQTAGERRATEQLKPVITHLNGILKELAGVRAVVRKDAERGTVELAVAIARRILHREIATDPEAILGLVKSASERLNARETHRLRVNPADAKVIQEHRGWMNLPNGLEIIPDATLGAGAAVFETPRGEMDASINTQLDEISRGLTDLVRRRPR